MTLLWLAASYLLCLGDGRMEVGLEVGAELCRAAPAADISAVTRAILSSILSGKGKVEEEPLAKAVDDGVGGGIDFSLGSVSITGARKPGGGALHT